MMITKTFIIVTFNVEGMHCFPRAAELYPEVAFLSDRHRHTFNFKVCFNVMHTDRDKEFIIVKRDLINYIKSNYYSEITRTHEFGARSCEQIASEILSEFNAVWAEVWEDNECGARVEKYIS